MTRHSTLMLVLIAAGCVNLARAAEESRFTKTHSRGQYVHWIDLYDAADRRIDPTAESPPPYSPRFTCGRCHDYAAIATGHHFNAIAKQAAPGRPGEPWIWTDERTGTQIPLSYRGWPGTYDPGALGISSRDFVLKFGHHLPGGGPGEAVPELPQTEEAAATTEESAEAEKAEEVEGAGEAGEAEEAEEAGEAEPTQEAIEAKRWKLSGMLDVDCMICHGNDRAYSQEARWKQIEQENFAWAPTAALGIGNVEGRVSSLPDDFDPATAEPESREKLPTTTYTPARINGEKKIFFDVIRKPGNTACYYCHSTNPVGEHSRPDWTHDEDVHLRAGFTCSDCHRNGIAHHTVRGFEGEEHPTGEPVETLSCRGCHLNDGHGGGRMGAPKPLHKGLPPLHFEKLSCTACHSGPMIGQRAESLQTSLAHGLGLPVHATGSASSGIVPPGIVAPVMLREDGMLFPHRIVWPAFWGQLKDDAITPLNPEDVYDATRRTLRVRRGTGFAEAMAKVRLSSSDKKEILGEDRYKTKEEELTDEEKAKLAEAVATRARENWKEKLAAALTGLKAILTVPDAEPVFVSAGKVYKLGTEEAIETIEHDAAKPYAWKFGHDVRPARLALGAAKGCYDCHTLGAPLFESTVTAVGQAPDETPVTRAMHQMAGYDKVKIDAWANSFKGRKLFKVFGYGAMGVLGLVLLAYLFAGITSLFPLGRRP